MKIKKHKKFANGIGNKNSMRLYIPKLGERFRLTADWTFILHFEDRNKSLLQATGQWPEGNPRHIYFDYHAKNGKGVEVVTLPAGSVLSMSRIYIRNGLSKFDSVTFVLIKGTAPEPFKKGGRFWVKLEDANTIEMELVEK